ncbi:hypothetical protein [Rhizobium sp.]|uniref:ATP dependent DNA ligase n=1 Tax=Rhizobium sp. TaxID=391 RepID=UPI002896DB1A
MRSRPLTHKTDALAEPRKARQIEAPNLAYDPEYDRGDETAAPSTPTPSRRCAFFIAGYEATPDAPAEIGSLVLAAYQRHDLVYVGRVRAVLNDAETRKLRTMMDALRWKQKKPPIRCEVAAFDGADIVWVYPTLIADIMVSTWGSGGMIDNASYEGLADRQDNADVFRLEKFIGAGETSARL